MNSTKSYKSFNSSLQSDNCYHARKVSSLIHLCTSLIRHILVLMQVYKFNLLVFRIFVIWGTHLIFSQWSWELLLNISPPKSNMDSSFKSSSEMRDHNCQKRKDWNSTYTRGRNSWIIKSTLTQKCSAESSLQLISPKSLPRSFNLLRPNLLHWEE